MVEGCPELCCGELSPEGRPSVAQDAPYQYGSECSVVDLSKEYESFMLSLWWWRPIGEGRGDKVNYFPPELPVKIPALNQVPVVFKLGAAYSAASLGSVLIHFAFLGVNEEGLVQKFVPKLLVLVSCDRGAQ